MKKTAKKTKPASFASWDIYIKKNLTELQNIKTT